jgi:Fe2+ or Zn2+ uptake regulation protein
MASQKQAAKEATRVRRALLLTLLTQPRAWSMSELRADLSPASGDEDEATVVFAVAQLKDVGLVHWHGEFVIPTLAATQADALSI